MFSRCTFLKSLAFKMKHYISRNLYNLIMGLIGHIDSCAVRRKITDVMFIYDIINYNINSPEIFFNNYFNILCWV